MSKPTVRAHCVAAMTEGGPGHALWSSQDEQPEDERVAEAAFQRLHPGGFRPTGSAERSGFRYRADWGYGYECVLRKQRAPCDDAGFPHHHGG